MAFKYCQGPWLPLLTCLVQANFLLVAWYGSKLLFWSRSAKPTRSKISFSLNGRDSLLLMTFSLLLFSLLLRQIILCPTPIFQKKSKSKFLSDLGYFFLFAFPFHTLATGVYTVSTNACFGIDLCRFRGRISVLKQEWILSRATKIPYFYSPISVLLPLESKRCLLKPAWVLACAV